MELRSFEYRFRLRLLQPVKNVVKMGLIEDDRCKQCSHPSEDLTLIFWECVMVAIVGFRLLQWFNAIFNLDIQIDPRTVLFKMVDDTGVDIPVVFWLCCLLVKKDIWTTRSLNSIHKALRTTSHTEKLEARIAIKNRKIGKHRLKLGPLSSVHLTEEDGNVKVVNVDTMTSLQLPGYKGQGQTSKVTIIYTFTGQ